MSDIAFINLDGNGFDFATDGYDLVLSDGLVEGLIHSIFRDGRAPDSVIPVGDDPRGHWASGLEDDAPDGSLLWLFAREAITPGMPHRVADALKNACAWMIDSKDGVFASVTGIEAEAVKAARRGRIDATLTVLLSSEPYSRQFRIVYDPASRRYELKEV